MMQQEMYGSGQQVFIEQIQVQMMHDGGYFGWAGSAIDYGAGYPACYHKNSKAVLDSSDYGMRIALYL